MADMTTPLHDTRTFGRDELLELIAHADAPAISLYLAIERDNLTKKSTRLRYRAAVDEATRLLREDPTCPPERWRPLIEEMYARVDDSSFWHDMPAGMAMFAAPGLERVYRLPVRFEDQVHVATSFHTRPLMAYMLSPERYWVLAVAQKEVQLYEGHRWGLHPVDVPEMPRDLQDALQIERSKDQDSLSYRSSSSHMSSRLAPQSGPTGRDFAAPIFHGHGGGRDQRDAYLREYMQLILHAAAPHVAGQSAPVLFAGVDFLHPLFRQQCDWPNRMDEGVVGGVHSWNLTELHERAWPLVARTVDGRIRENLDLWERAYGTGKGELDVTTMARRIVEGRVRTLLVDEQSHLWGRFDTNSGHVQIIGNGPRDPAARWADILDDFSEQVILRGGIALFVPPHMMPANSSVAAILR